MFSNCRACIFPIDSDCAADKSRADAALNLNYFKVKSH